MVLRRLCDSARNAAVSGKENPKWRAGNDGGLPARDKRGGEVLRLDWSLLDVIPQTEIRRKSRRDSIIVLRKECVIPGIQQSMVRVVLFHAGDLAGDEVSRHIPGRRWSRRVEVDDSKVIQIADNLIFFERQFGSKVKSVSAFGHADNVTQAVEIGVAYRTSQRTAGVEVVRKSQLWKTLSAPGS